MSTPAKPADPSLEAIALSAFRLGYQTALRDAIRVIKHNDTPIEVLEKIGNLKPSEAPL